MELCDDSVWGRLPDELVDMILLGHIAPRWRFLLRPVCARWTAVLDRAGDETRDRPRIKCADRDLSRRMPDVPWYTLWESVERNGYHGTLCRWRRGSIVVASTVAEWARHAPTAWGDADAEALVRWCTNVGNATLPQAAGVLAASGRLAFVRHAFDGVMPACPFDEPKHPNVHYLTGAAFVRDECTPLGLENRLVRAVTKSDSVDAVELALSLAPRFDWTQFGEMYWLIEGDHADAVACMLALWVVHNRSNGLAHIETIWAWIGWEGAVRVLRRLLDIMTIPGRDTVTDEDLDLFITRLAATWTSDAGLGTCVMRAVENGQTAVLAALRDRIVAHEGLALRVFEHVCRCGNVEMIRWARTNLRPGATVADVARLAVMPVYGNGEYRYSVDPAVVLDWLFDPRGGALDVTRQEIGRLFYAAATEDTTCALWFAERRTRDFVALGARAIRTLVKRACETSMDRFIDRGITGGTLERLIRALDACATAASAVGDTIECDIWPTLLDVSRRQTHYDGTRPHKALRYAWTRANTSIDPADIDFLDGCGPEPAPRASWVRWCCVRPARIGAFWNREVNRTMGEKGTRIIDWMRAKDLLIEPASNDTAVALGNA